MESVTVGQTVVGVVRCDHLHRKDISAQRQHFVLT